MRRAPIVIASTLIGTVAVLTFRPREAAVASSAAASAAVSQATVTTKGSTTIATGGPIASQFGTTQVRVTITAGKITDVQALKYNNDEPQSIQISQAAIPTLRQEVLAKQSAAVDAVSGATITSDAYEASLQSALDKAGFKAPDGSTAPTTAPTAGKGRDDHGPGDGGHGFGGF